MTQRRRRSGQFGKGPQSEEHKQSISQGQIDRHKRDRESRVSEPTGKRCTKCKQFKNLNEFPKKRVRIKSGVTIYRAGECLLCLRKRSEAYRDKLRAEGTLKEKNRQYARDRNREKKNKYNRDWDRFRRLEKGMKSRGPIKKYRNERDPDRHVLRKPFADRLAEIGISHSQLALMTGFDSTVFGKKSKFVSFGVVDKTYTHLGIHDQVSVDYPLE